MGDTVVGGDNPFDSSVAGTREPAFVNNLGVDIDAYDLTIDSPAGTFRIDATSADDGIRFVLEYAVLEAVFLYLDKARARLDAPYRRS